MPAGMAEVIRLHSLVVFLHRTGGMRPWRLRFRVDASEPRVDLEALHAKIGQLALENDFLRCAREGGFAGWREK